MEEKVVLVSYFTGTRMYVQLFRENFLRRVFASPHESAIFYSAPFDIYAKWKYVRRTANAIADAMRVLKNIGLGYSKVPHRVKSSWRGAAQHQNRVTPSELYTIEYRVCGIPIYYSRCSFEF